MHFALFLSAQVDSVLSEVEISGDPVHLFANGNKFKKIEVGEGARSLADALSTEGNIYFKSYGNQQLATIAMRGTSANQTNVLWHGIPVNYPTLGLMDFSQWPAWFLSTVELQAGNGGALFGSGSIGGTVLLDSDTYLDDEMGVTSRGDAGSYGYSFLGFDGKYLLGGLRGRTKVYRTQLDNNFPYQFNGEKYTQQNAGSLDYGLQQQLQWSAGKHQFLLDGMFTNNDREIQPSKGVDNNDFLETNNTRVAFTHKYTGYRGSFNTSLGYISNATLYNYNQRTESYQYSIVSSYVFELGSQTIARVGVNSNIFQASSENYVGKLDDMRTGIFGSIRTQLTRIWDVSINLRQSIFEGRYPFTPSLNQKFRLLKDKNNTIFLTQSISSGFRFPTLNDLYWAPGGNPDLIPESSFSVEAGIQWERRWSAATFSLLSNGYSMWARDYILWRPGEAFWSPENLQEVKVQGVELKSHLKVKVGGITQNFMGSYAFTRSLNQTGDHSGNLLPYIPEHQATLKTETRWQGWRVGMNTNYTSRRFTTLDNTRLQSVDGFFLVGLNISREILIEKWHFNVGGRINNMLDASYENLINRAMPGRNYQLYLIITR